MNRKTTRVIAPVIVVAGVATAAIVSTVPPASNASGSAFVAPASAAPQSSAASAAPPTPGVAAAAGPLGLLRVDYDFQRQGRPASNQFAIWIESADGRYIDTVFATSWIANGGWTRRPMSMPEWREASDWANASTQQIESASRPAPRTGSQTVYWDGLDSNGQPVPAGDYVLKVEGNVEWERMVAYEAPFTIGEAGEQADAEQTRNDQPEDTMLDAVAIAWLPGEEMTPETTTEYTRGS